MAGGQFILKDTPITIPATLLEAFQQTADYTDDYDSNHADGDYATGGISACYSPDDYPASLLHRPADALRTGGGGSSTIPDEKCAIIADDLMYWAMKRTAQLFRLFYREADPGPFHAEIRFAEQGFALSTDESAPVPYLGPKKALLHVAYSTRAQGDFPPSGIVRNSCTLHYDFKPEGGSWTGEQTKPFPEGAGTISLDTQPGIYRVWVSAENGGGKLAEPFYGYFRAQGFALVLAPKSGAVECKGSLQLSVKVSGTGQGVTYAWYKDGQLIPNADSDKYIVDNVTFGDAGRYTCVVTDPDHGTLVTPAAIVQVVPENRLPAAGPATLFVEAGVLLALGMLLAASELRRRPERAKR